MIPTMEFGRTGHLTTRTIFGAASLGRVTQSVADKTLDLLLQFGVNHIDTAASYGDAELHIGPWMDRHRTEFFLATKTGERTYQKARDEIHRSLDRLRVDHVDLLQLHFLIDRDEWKTALGPDGALDAVVEAREEGLTRFIGVTGHELAAPVRHMESLARFPFDSVLLPLNYLLMSDSTYAADFTTLLEKCQRDGIAVQTIKSLARGPWDQKVPTRATWYEPVEDPSSIELAVRYVLGFPQVFLNTVGDVNLLPHVLEAASRFRTAPTIEEMTTMVEREELAPIFR